MLLARRSRDLETLLQLARCICARAIVNDYQVFGYENLSITEEVDGSKLDVFQEELKLLSKSARVS